MLKRPSYGLEAGGALGAGACWGAGVPPCGADCAGGACCWGVVLVSVLPCWAGGVVCWFVSVLVLSVDVFCWSLWLELLWLLVACAEKNVVLPLPATEPPNTSSCTVSTTAAMTKASTPVTIAARRCQRRRGELP